MRRGNGSVQTDVPPQEVGPPHVAFWSDTSGGSQVQPGLRRFFSKQEVLEFLAKRAEMHGQVQEFTGQPFKLESARVMREACIKLHRKLKNTEDWKQFEKSPLDLSGVIAAYADKHRRRTVDVKDVPKPKREDRSIPDHLRWLEDDSPAQKARAGDSGGLIRQQGDIEAEVAIEK